MLALWLGPVAPAGADPPLAAEAADPSGGAVGEHRPATSPTAAETEIVGFILRGRQPHEKVTIDDLGVIPLGPDRRLIPTLRVLKALGVEVATEGGKIAFQVSGAPAVVLEPDARRIQINGRGKIVDLLVARSEITNQQELYLPSDVLSEALAIELKWSREDYAFVADVDRQLDLWKREGPLSLLATDVETVPTDLPEALPAAKPVRSGLHFLEFQLRSRSPLMTGADRTDSTLHALQATLWGSMREGRYKLRFSQPTVYFGRSGIRLPESALPRISWGDWTLRSGNSEIALGDSVFGLSNLTLPIVRMTGIRINGLTGPPGGRLGDDRSQLGRRYYFVRSHIFEGRAPVGSKVRLVINNRTVATQQITDVEDDEDDEGSYRFEDISLPVDYLNDIRIVITEPDGTERQIKKSLLGSSLLLPKGRLAYLLALGTKRELRDWGAHGAVACGRFLYGVTERFTVGGSVGFLEDFHLPIEGIIDSDQRQYPPSSLHLGAEFAWIPADFLQVKGELCAGQGGPGGVGGYEDLAFRLRGDFHPIRDLSLHTYLFRYGPSFFNGQNVNLYDREGYCLDVSWKPHRKWTMKAMMGRVRDNLDGRGNASRLAQFRNVQITTQVIPRTALTLSSSQVTDEAGDPRSLHELSIRAYGLARLELTGRVATGEPLSSGGNSELFSGVPVRGFTVYQSPSTTIHLSRSINPANRVGMGFWDSANRTKASVYHSFRAQRRRGLRVRTEVGQSAGQGYALGAGSLYFSNRSEICLDASGRTRMGLQTRYQQDEWTAMLFFSLTELYCFNNRRVIRVTDRRINPDRGAVHGMVFLDYNSNGRLDSDEPGIEDVRVRAGKLYAATTDRNGYFILPCLTRAEKFRVSLDLDTVPAIYVPTHGTQTAHVVGGNVTVINLGVTPLITISGRVLAVGGTKQVDPLPGVRVVLSRQADGEFVADSITAGDGSYYLGEVRPGRYVLSVDAETLPEGYAMPAVAQELEILPKKEPQEVRPQPFLAMPSRAPGLIFSPRPIPAPRAGPEKLVAKANGDATAAEKN